jgi:Bacterial SH3 domain
MACVNSNTSQRPVAPQRVGKTLVVKKRFGLLAVPLVLCGALLLISCQQGPPQERAIGVAYAGPASLILRKELSSRSSATTTVPHGEEVEILETRRRFVRVRTSTGAQGWTDANLLLTSEQMDDLKRLFAQVAELPSEGSATVAEALNAHTEPSRLAPSFFQVPENGMVEVVGHRVAPRNAPPTTAANVVPPAVPVAKKAKAKQGKAALLIPAPKPPGPPANWVEISRPRVRDLPGFVAPAPPPSAPVDDWSLVRTKDGKAGWVLSRMLFMAVPDELAQYAEGRRITAYQILGDVQDGDKLKHDWMWVTISPGNRANEFDAIRVFVWSLKRHHYETAYSERNVQGFYPVQLAKLPGNPENGFSLVAQEKDGTLMKRTYAFVGRRVRVVSREPFVPAAEGPDLPKISAAPVKAAPVKLSMWASFTTKVKQMWTNGAR